MILFAETEKAKTSMYFPVKTFSFFMVYPS